MSQPELAISKAAKWIPIHGEVSIIALAIANTTGRSYSGSQVEEADSKDSKRARTSSRSFDDYHVSDAFNGVRSSACSYCCKSDIEGLTSA